MSARSSSSEALSARVRTMKPPFSSAGSSSFSRSRRAARPLSSSIFCATPALVIATRVSRGVTLMRISSCTRSVQPLDELPGLIKRQAHYAGVAAAQMHDEQGGPPLDRVGAGLVVALAAGDVLLDLVLGERLEAHFRDREGAFQPVGLL